MLHKALQASKSQRGRTEVNPIVTCVRDLQLTEAGHRSKPYVLIFAGLPLFVGGVQVVSRATGFIGSVYCLKRFMSVTN